ncbi:MAG TPA: ATP-binding protein [Candidatus Saccharimonadales bacterium]|nr:ATP-binding protein [Candidatus Saccharimonadales bacterium]
MPDGAITDRSVTSAVGAAPPHDDGRGQPGVGPDGDQLARFMAEAGRILGESLDFETTLRRVAALAVPRIADWCAVELLTEDGRLVELALAHEDPAKAELVRELRRDYPPRRDAPNGAWSVIASGEPQLISDLSPEMLAAAARDERHATLIAELDLRSYMCVPLQAGGRMLGTITLASGGSGRRFDRADLAFALDLASRAAAAIDNARTYQVADRFRRILDAVAEAVFVIDPNDGARIRDVNRGALELLGYRREDLIGMPFWSGIVGLGDAEAERLMEPVRDGRVEARTVDLHLRRAVGPGLPVEVILQRVDLPGESGLVAIARDVSERVDTDARLQHLAEAEHARAAELNAVIRAMGDGVIVCASDGRISLANPAGQDLFPEVDEQTYQEVLDELIDPEHLAPALGRHGGPVVLPTRRDPDRWIEVATYPVTGEASGGAGHGETIVVLRDVTAARQREAVRETFIGVLSHELRTPVTTIYGGAKTLAREGSTLDEATRREIFIDIAAEAERLQRLVEDVVALNRFGEDDGDLGQEPVLLQRVVPVVVRSEETRWPGVTFDIQVPSGLATVVADPTYVEQVVRNLLSNAAKYGGSGSSVDVVLEAAEDEVLVRILDDGPGILAEEAERLFELFYRSPSTAGMTSGAGIGLFVSARLVRAMGGRIWALPRPAGGAEFGFALRVMADD